MKHSSGGFWSRRIGAKAPTQPGAEPEATLEDTRDPDSIELHVCCICGALLGFDFEDEINGEGWGRDICGDCNRTKNFQAMMGWE